MNINRVLINDIDLASLGLIATDADIPFPKPKVYQVDVPGMNGSYDLTDTMGDITFENIVITINWNSRANEFETRQILRQFNGLKINLELHNDTYGEIYVGRVQSCTVKASGECSTGTIKIEANPEAKYVPN